MTTTPRLRILGPVQVQDAGGPTPPAPGRITELVAFLALHPWPNATLLDEAMWPGQRITASTRNRATNQARSWLGTSPDGRPWVGLVAETGYALDPAMPVDWWDYQQLVGTDPTHASTAQLHRALTLVTGQPFSGVLPTRYAWAETDRCEIIAAVADGALELAERAARSGDTRTTGWAVAKGLAVEPTHEALWRCALTHAASSGQPERLSRTLTQLHATLEPLGGPDPQTQHLIDTLSTVHGRRVTRLG